MCEKKQTEKMHITYRSEILDKWGKKRTDKQKNILTINIQTERWKERETLQYDKNNSLTYKDDIKCKNCENNSDIYSVF